MTERAAVTLQATAVIVVAGGRGTRLGGRELGDKARHRVDGVPLLQHTLNSIPRPNRPSTPSWVIVGPTVNLPPELAQHVAAWTIERPAGAGPCAAIVAGVEALRRSADLDDASFVALLPGDAPAGGRGLDALMAALAATPSADAAVFTRDDRVNHLMALWRRDELIAATTRVPDGGLDRPVSELYANSSMVVVDDEHSWSADVDTPADLAAVKLAANADISTVNSNST